MAYRRPADQAHYGRQHYARNRDVAKRRARKYTKAQNLHLAAIVRAAKDRPCTDCGQRYPHYVMDLDHLNPRIKVAALADAATSGWSEGRLRLEIAKCEVVCANCHRERTWQRRQAPPEPAAQEPLVDDLTLWETA